MADERKWTRQWAQSGIYVREKRFILTRSSQKDSPEQRRDKQFLRNNSRFYRDPVDRAESRLAHFRLDGIHASLTFDRDHLPENYAGTLTYFQDFILRCRYLRQRRGKPPDFPYVKRIEYFTDTGG